MAEMWADIGIGTYKVSTLGRVKKRDMYLKPQVSARGYITYSLCEDGKRHYCLAHRLVAKAFLTRQPHHTEVNHLDGEKTNNDVDNLEWSTRSLNELHRARVLKRGIGSLNGNSRLKAEDVIEIRLMSMGGLSLNNISSWKRTSKSQVSRILKGRHWAHL
jgi:hypothetical protein